MERYKTNASKAEKEIKELLNVKDNFFRPWHLLDYKMNSRTLSTTDDEVILLFNKQAHLRPGFEICDKLVYIPNIFVKLTGEDISSSILKDTNKTKKDNVIEFKSIEEFNALNKYKRVNKDKLEEVIENGIINKEKLYNSKIYKYSYLREEYQDLLVEKINEILINKKTYFTNRVNSSDILKIINILLNIDENIIMMLHNYDFQYNIPGIIINHENQSIFTNYSAYVLLLLNLLGFDIVIISTKGFSNIELVLKKELFDVHFNKNWKNGFNIKNTRKRNNWLIASLVSSLVIVSLLTIYKVSSINNNHNDNSNVIYYEEINNDIENIELISFNDGDVYKGEKKDNKRHGQGTMEFINGDKYIGEWKDNKIDGTGTFYFLEGGVKYNGQFKNNKMNGRGEIIFPEINLKYNGYFVDNMAHGKGTLIGPNGSNYLGEFKYVDIMVMANILIQNVK